MGIKVINEKLFGYETPFISFHCMKRYAQRFLGIAENYAESYTKVNKGRIVKEIFQKIPEVVEIEISEENLLEIQRKHGYFQMRFLVYRNKLMFVIQRDINNNRWLIKTCYRTDGK